MIVIWSRTTFKTENFAEDAIILENEKDLEKISEAIKTWKKITVIWWWSNLLLAKQKYENEIFVRNNFKWRTELSPWIVKFNSWTVLSTWTKQRSEQKSSNKLNGRDWLPWTIGWAVAWNAESFWLAIWPFVKEICYIDEQWTEQTTSDYTFEYRKSNFKDRKNIFIKTITCEFPLWNDESINPCEFYMKRRLERQEYNKTCGSFFKNVNLNKKNLTSDQEKMIEKVLSFATNPLKKQIETANEKLIIPAWRLVENAWLKWFDIWWVKVSEKHANFISNYANKDPQKIIDLKNMIQERVKETFWCILEPEVIIY